MPRRCERQAGDRRIDHGQRGLDARGFGLRAQRAVVLRERLRLADADGARVGADEATNEHVRGETVERAGFDELERGTRHLRRERDLADRQRALFTRAAQRRSEVLNVLDHQVVAFSNTAESHRHQTRDPSGAEARTAAPRAVRIGVPLVVKVVSRLAGFPNVPKHL
jgi:hypothetical protein